jgi:hypothetical protein
VPPRLLPSYIVVAVNRDGVSTSVTLPCIVCVQASVRLAAGVQRQVHSSIKVRRAAGDLGTSPHNPDVTATRLRLQAAIDMHTALRLADDDELVAARGLISDILEQVCLAAPDAVHAIIWNLEQVTQAAALHLFPQRF